VFNSTLLIALLERDASDALVIWAKREFTAPKYETLGRRADAYVPLP